MFVLLEKYVLNIPFADHKATEGYYNFVKVTYSLVAVYFDLYLF